ncbi:MAG: SUMF1/EgtB/PvdO family nonheme iron enzyme [Candidatus Aminicenantes bacterium]|nr:SUMF1/EgtB/PvdO family nonheme iron enzyme [Candidatus Aminicenantes bacterium]
MTSDKVLKDVLEKLANEYEFIRPIGQGAFSDVYLLKHKILQEIRALKIMSYNGSRIEELNEIKKRFIDEAKLMEKISHPNIIRTHETASIKDETQEDFEIPFTIMSFMEGETLRELLDSVPTLAVDRIKSISGDILSALGILHKNGIIHRDIKPENILIDKETGKAVLIDFGLAEKLTPGLTSTALDAPRGTPVYMAPEQFQDGGKLGPQADIYSYGVLLYEMLTGKVPYRGNLPEIMHGHLTAPIPDVREMNPLAPHGIQRIIEKAMAKDAEARYQNAEDLWSALEEVIGKEQERNNRDDERIPPKNPNRLYLYILLILAVAAFVVFNPLHIGRSKLSDEEKYKSQISLAKEYYRKGELEKAMEKVKNAIAIKKTKEAIDLFDKIARDIEGERKREKMGNDYVELKTLKERDDIPVDQKRAACEKFLKDHEKTPKTKKEEDMVLQVKEWIDLLDKESEDKEYREFISAAKDNIKELNLKMAEENYAKAKEINPTGKELAELDKAIKYVKTLKKMAKITKNQKNLWEADFGDGIVMVYIPAANGYGYWMGKTEVSIKQYKQFVNKTHSNWPEWMEPGSKFNITSGSDDYYKEFVEDERRPIVGISWENASAYCRWLSGKTDLRFKLPTEKQWQAAAQGADSRIYPWGDSSPDTSLANFGSPTGMPQKVDAYTGGASHYGLLNMAGNVEEWCEKLFSSQDKNSCAARGGSFIDNQNDIRCTSRRVYDASKRQKFIGFRLCMEYK